MTEFNKLKKIKLIENKECIICRSRENLEVDHVIPVVLGGSDSLENLQVLCHDCHKKKTSSELKYRSSRKRSASNVSVVNIDKHNNQGKITIPSFILSMKNLSKGDILEWRFNDLGQIVVIPKKKN